MHPSLFPSCCRLDCWNAYTDESTGYEYFWNYITNQRQWEHPEGWPRPQPTGQPPQPPADHPIILQQAAAAAAAQLAKEQATAAAAAATAALPPPPPAGILTASSAGVAPPPRTGSASGTPVAAPMSPLQQTVAAMTATGKNGALALPPPAAGAGMPGVLETFVSMASAASDDFGGIEAAAMKAIGGYHASDEEDDT